MPSLPILPIGSLDHRYQHGRIFGIRPQDLLRHVYVIGKTGSGKSALLERLAFEEIRAGRGVAVLDPHGDLADRLLDLVPRRRWNEVILFDPADLNHPIGLNVLEFVGKDERSLVVSGILSVFRKVFCEFWGPRMEHVFRNSLFALLERQDSTLLGVMCMLLDARFRGKVVESVEDPVVRFFWTKEFPGYQPAFLAEVVSPVENKVAAVLTSPCLRNILGQRRTSFSFRELMDEGRILIANLSKGRIGEDASSLLGAMLVTRFQLAAYSRANIPLEERRPFTLYVDEFASFATRSFADLLSESRKYHLSLVLANQFLGQLEEPLRRAVLGNVGTLIVFRLGAEDAEILGKEFEPEISAEDLTRLESHQIALRLSVDGMMTRSFTATTLLPIGEDQYQGGAATIRRISAERYGKPRPKVELEIAEQMEQDLGG